MTTSRRRIRARWIAVLCALAAIPVVVAGVRVGVRHVRENRAIERLRSPKDADRQAALMELAELRSIRGVSEIVSSMAADEFSSAPGRGARSWESLCAGAIGQIGVEAIPGLFSKLESPELAERLFAIRFLYRVPERAPAQPGRRLLAFLGDPVSEVRDQAALGLGCLALTDSLLLDRLIDELGRTGGKEDRRDALARAIGIAASPDQVADLLGSRRVEEPPGGEADSPERTASVLRATLCLLESLEDPSVRVRETCLHGLRRVLARAPPEIRSRLQGILRRWLTDSEAWVRSLALDWLGDGFPLKPNLAFFPPRGAFEPELPRDVLDMLGTLLVDPDPGVRWKAARHLGSPRAVPTLVAALDQDGPASPREEALRILHSLTGAEAWSGVFALLERPDGSIRPDAVELLSSMGEKEGFGVVRLSQAIDSKRPEVRRAAARVLGRYHMRGSVEAHRLFALLHDDDDGVFAEAAAALAVSGNLDVEALERRVLELLDPARPVPVIEAACRAAGGLGRRASTAVPRLVPLLGGPEREARLAATAALGAIGPAARAAVPALLAGAEGLDRELAAGAVEALARISPDDAISPALRALGHESGRMREAGQAALWSMGSRAAAALPELRKLAEQDVDLDLATRAAVLVGRIEGSEPRE